MIDDKTSKVKNALCDYLTFLKFYSFPFLPIRGEYFPRTLMNKNHTNLYKLCAPFIIGNAGESMTNIDIDNFDFLKFEFYRMRAKCPF